MFTLCMSVLFPESMCHMFVGISDLGNLGECSGLERLNLSRNNIAKLYAIAGLTNLMYLNLAANRITSLGNCYHS